MLCFVSKLLAWVNMGLDGGALTSLRMQEAQDRDGQCEAARALCSTVSKGLH